MEQTYSKIDLCIRLELSGFLDFCKCNRLYENVYTALVRNIRYVMFSCMHYIYNPFNISVPSTLRPVTIGTLEISSFLIFFNKSTAIFGLGVKREQSAVVLEVERWPHTPMSVGSNPSAAVDCLP